MDKLLDDEAETVNDTEGEPDAATAAAPPLDLDDDCDGARRTTLQSALPSNRQSVASSFCSVSSDCP